MRRVLWLAAICVPLWFTMVANAAEPGRTELRGHVPPVVSRLVAESRLPATNQLYLAIGLPLRNQAGLDELLRQLYDPASTNFHKFLTSPEFTARFGPTEQDYAAVRKFAENNGFTVTGTSDSRMVLDVQARATDVEQAFQVTLRNYRHPTEPRSFFAPDTEPSVPTNLPVADMWGLSDYARPRPLSHFADPARLTPATYNGSGANGSYRGTDFRNAFAPGAKLTGQGQVAAVMELDGYYPADITNYEAQCGYTNVPLQNVYLDNVSGTPGYSGVANAVLEVSMDIELAIAMAPGLAKVMVYEGNNFYDVFNQIASDNTAKQISSSWTSGNGPSANWKASPGSTLDSLLAKMVAQGQAFFQASGDSDAYTGSQTLNSSTGPIPVDSIYVTSVGGTSLSMNGTGASWASEAVWNWNNSGNPNVGSGGGVSPNYSIPSWQTNVSMALNGGSTVNRNLPDVAMPAEAIYVIYNNGSTSGYIGGTSAAAPLWAGFCALINQQVAASGGTNIGFLNPAIYSLAATSNYPNCFHDITVGNNIGSGTAGEYSAVAGYDLCTGLGTPNGTNLINTLAPFPACLSQPASQNVTNGANVAFSVAVAGAPPLYFQWLFNGTNLSSGGNITGSSSNVLSLTAVTAANAGNYSLVLSNSYGSLTSSIAVLTIGIPPAFSMQPTNLTVLAGNNAVFAATVTGSASLVYQWLKNGTNMSNGTGVSGANSSVLTLTAVTASSAGNYSVSVTNLYGSATSSVAVLNVNFAPVISTQPANLNVLSGSNAVFSVTASGTAPLAYQWQESGTNLSNGTGISGAMSNVLTLAAVTTNSSGNYSLVITNAFGSVTSSVAVLNVGFAPAITTQPANLNVLSGSNAVFSAAAAGSTPLAYQWRQNGTNLANGAGISGANSNVLTLTAVTTSSAGNYNWFVTNLYGSATSSVATLTVLLPASITNAGWALLAGNATPTNGAINPGETVTVSFTLQNQGTVSTTNLVATLLASTNLLAPSAPQTYGAVAGSGGATNKSFIFTAAGACGSNIVATLQLQDGTNNLGFVNFSLPLGEATSSQTFAQNFDGVAAPELPSGWSTTNITGTANSWESSTAAYDTAPNSAFISDVASTSENALVSPVIPILSANAQLVFRHNYSFDYHSTSQYVYRDGGVLEIKIGTGSFTDIVTAGGSFATGGYNNVIDSNHINPLNGRSAWVGISNYWQTVNVNLPASAAGQNVQLRWNCGTDSSNTGSGAVGWYVDSISITDSVFNCETVITDLAISQSLAASSLQAGQNLIYTLSVTNLGPQSAANVVVTDTVPANASFVSAPGGSYAGGQVVFTSAMLPVNSVTNFTLTLAPVSGYVFTNVASVATITPEVGATNSSTVLVATQIVEVPASITNAPVAQTIQCGSNASFTVSATGTAPLNYQWSLDGAAIAAATNTSLLLTNVHLPSHTVSVVVTNLYGSATSSVPLTVQDTLAPVITLNSTNPFYVQLGNAYPEPGATGYDLCAGVVPVSISGAVNTNAVSTNTVTYTATDGNGNTNTATRTVIVQDTTPPTILWSFTNLLLAANSNCVAVMPNVTGTNYIMATDASGLLTFTQSPTNGAALPLGTNLVVITVADASGNKSYSTNRIAVRDLTPPVLALNGFNPMTNQLGVPVHRSGRDRQRRLFGRCAADHQRHGQCQCHRHESVDLHRRGWQRQYQYRHAHRLGSRHHTADNFVELHESRAGGQFKLRGGHAWRDGNKLHSCHGLVRRGFHHPKPHQRRNLAAWHQRGGHCGGRSLWQHGGIDE